MMIGGNGRYNGNWPSHPHRNDKPQVRAPRLGHVLLLWACAASLAGVVPWRSRTRGHRELSLAEDALWCSDNSGGKGRYMKGWAALAALCCYLACFSEVAVSGSPAEVLLNFHNQPTEK